jgi:mannose-6-phosphate isomerase-like protein (cupin superfamily)
MTRQDLWFLSNHVTIGTSKADNADGVSVLKLRMPHDEAPPLHVHRSEDEIFHILRGEIRFQIGERIVNARTGDTLVAPRGIPHGFRVTSVDGAEMLTITRGGFEDLVRQIGRPAERADLPSAPAMSTDLETELAAACRHNGIDLLGPPIA